MVAFGSVDEVARALRAGQAAVFPTDTVYGIGVAVTRAASPIEVYDAKRRDHDKPLPWLVDGLTALDMFGHDVPEYARALARAYWPGQLTLIVPASSAVPREFGAENRTVALRMPDDATALDLIARAGCPIANSSANFQGHTPPQSYADIDPDFLAQLAASCGDDAPRSGVSSTIVDCTGDVPRVVRVGVVSEEDIVRVCAGATQANDHTAHVKSTRQGDCSWINSDAKS